MNTLHPEILTNLWLITMNLSSYSFCTFTDGIFASISIHSKCLCSCFSFIRCTLANLVLFFCRVFIYLFFYEYIYIYILNQLLVDAVSFSCLQHHRCFYAFSKVSCCCLFCAGIFIVYKNKNNEMCQIYIYNGTKPEPIRLSFATTLVHFCSAQNCATSERCGWVWFLFLSTRRVSSWLICFRGSLHATVNVCVFVYRVLVANFFANMYDMYTLWYGMLLIKLLVIYNNRLSVSLFSFFLCFFLHWLVLHSSSALYRLL